MTQTNSLEDFTQAFGPISLECLNAKAAMLERLDNKYVVKAGVLNAAAARLKAEFDILEISGVRAFQYDTCYFDDPALSCYFDHHQGRRRRVKVRVRRYTDTGVCFVEVKLKDKRNVTVKKRLAYPLASYGTLNDAAFEHVKTCYYDHYQEAFACELAPALEIFYRRMTLVAKSGGERLTIDSALRFKNASREADLGETLFIIETKSANGNGIADRILREHKQHPTKHCSKYCIGTALTGTVTKYNKFRPAIRKLGALEDVQF